MPRGVHVSGLESGGGDRFFCGGGKTGKVRAVRRPRDGEGLKPPGPLKKQVVETTVWDFLDRFGIHCGEYRGLVAKRITTSEPAMMR